MAFSDQMRAVGTTHGGPPVTKYYPVAAAAVFPAGSFVGLDDSGEVDLPVLLTADVSKVLGVALAAIETAAAGQTVPVALATADTIFSIAADGAYLVTQLGGRVDCIQNSDNAAATFEADNDTAPTAAGNTVGTSTDILLIVGRDENDLTSGPGGFGRVLVTVVPHFSQAAGGMVGV